MKVKKWLSVLLSTAIVVSAAVPSEALAKEPANVQGVLTDYQVDGIFGDLPDNDELFEGYVDRLFMGGSLRQETCQGRGCLRSPRDARGFLYTEPSL